MFLFQAGILDNLDKILAREIELGNFANVTEDTYRLPPDGMPYELYQVPPPPPDTRDGTSSQQGDLTGNVPGRRDLVYFEYILTTLGSTQIGQNVRIPSN